MCRRALGCEWGGAKDHWTAPVWCRALGCEWGGKRSGDQVIREDAAVRSSCVRGRGTETSAEVLVGPPWRMESNVGQQQWYGGYPCTPDGGPMGHSARSTVPPPPSASSVDVKRRTRSSGEKNDYVDAERAPKERLVAPSPWAALGVHVVVSPGSHAAWKGAGWHLPRFFEIRFKIKWLEKECIFQNFDQNKVSIIKIKYILYISIKTLDRNQVDFNQKQVLKCSPCSSNCLASSKSVHWLTSCRLR